MTTPSIQAIVKALDAPMRGLATFVQLKAWRLSPNALKKLPPCDKDFVRFVIKLANAIPYQVLRTASCVCLDLLLNQDMPSQCDHLDNLLTFLLETPLRDDIVWTERLDVGIVLYALRENAKMHVWHGHKYKDALRDRDFACQANALMRMRSGREMAWLNRMDRQETTSLASSQLKFAELTQSMATRPLSMPSRSASRDKWIAFLYEVSAAWGGQAMKRLGYEDDTKKIGLDFKTQVHDRFVGQDIGNGVLKTYLQVGSTIPSDWSIMGTILPHAVGMEAVFDMFLLTEKRWVCATTEEITALFCECSLDAFANAFEHATVKDPRVDCSHKPMEREDADRNAERLIQEEVDQQARVQVKNQKLRDKRKRRKTKARIDCCDYIDLSDNCSNCSSDRSSESNVCLENVIADVELEATIKMKQRKSKTKGRPTNEAEKATDAAKVQLPQNETGAQAVATVVETGAARGPRRLTDDDGQAAQILNDLKYLFEKSDLSDMFRD